MKGNAMGRSGGSWLDLTGTPTLPDIDDWGALIESAQPTTVPGVNPDPVNPKVRRSRVARFTDSWV